MGRFSLLAAVILLHSDQALATNTLCDFSGADQSGDYLFEFIGYGEIATIQVNAPRSARLGSYEVREFSYRQRRIHIVHAGGEEKGFLPPFTLKGVGDNVVLNIAGRRIVGEITCQWQHGS